MYNPHNWVSEEIITAEKLNNIETGVQNTEKEIETIRTIAKGEKGDTGTVDNAGLISAPAFQSLQNQVTDQSEIGINITAFDTKPNDNTFDNRAGIMNAIRSAVANGVNSVFIPSGTWYIDVHKPLYIPSNFTLWGIKGSSIIKAIKSTYSIITNDDSMNYQRNSLLALGDIVNEQIDTTGANIHDVYIDGLIIDGDVTAPLPIFSSNTDDGFSAGYGIYAGWGYNIQITNCEVKNTLGTGIMADRNYQTTIFGCKVHNCGNYGIIPSSRNGISMTGISAYDKKATTVSNCIVYDNGDMGIQFAYTNINIINNHVINNGTFGIEGDTAYTTDDSDDNNRGDCIISGNYIMGNGKIGIAIGNSNNQKILITGNIIRKHTETAISARQSNGALVTISHNIITECNNNSTNVSSIVNIEASKILVDGNHIYNCVAVNSSSITVDVSDNVILTNNQIEDCAVNTAFNIRALRIKVTNNTIKGKDILTNYIKRGVYIYGMSPENVDIIGNEFRNVYREVIKINPPTGIVRKISISNNNFINSSQGDGLYAIDVNSTTAGGTINVVSLIDNYCNKDTPIQTFGRFLDVGLNYTVNTFMTANNYVLAALNVYAPSIKCENTPVNVKQSNDVV